MRDVVVLSLIVVCFAAFLTGHVVLVHGIAKAKPRWHAAVALVVLPLAPYWGWRARLRARSIAWMVCAAVYLVARGVGATLT